MNIIYWGERGFEKVDPKQYLDVNEIYKAQKR